MADASLPKLPTASTMEGEIEIDPSVSRLIERMTNADLAEALPTEVQSTMADDEDDMALENAIIAELRREGIIPATGFAALTAEVSGSKHSSTGKASNESEALVPDAAFFRANRESQSGSRSKAMPKPLLIEHPHVQHAMSILIKIISKYRHSHPSSYFDVSHLQKGAIFCTMLQIDQKKPQGYLSRRFSIYLQEVKSDSCSNWQAWVARCMHYLNVRSIRPITANDIYVPESDRFRALQSIYTAMDEANFQLASTEGRFLNYEDLKAEACQRELHIHRMNAFDGVRMYRSKIDNAVQQLRAKGKEMAGAFCDQRYGREKPSLLEPAVKASSLGCG